MSPYLLINIAIIIFPLLFSFEKRVGFVYKWPEVFTAMAVISPVYVLWDIAATARGDWAFNPNFTLGVKIFGLPVEEILFFVTVPYSCLFIYESLRYYLGEHRVVFNAAIYRGMAVFCMMLSGVFYRKPYTCTVLLFVGIFLLVACQCYSYLLKSRLYWLFIAVTFLPFLIFNYLLTFPPIVSYGSEAIWGLRVLTIPVEDFLYSYSMLSWYLLIYLQARQKKLIPPGGVGYGSGSMS